MKTPRWRLEVDIRDGRILGDYIRFRGESYASLAQKVHEKCKKQVPAGPSKATIGHLVTGQTTRTKPEWARAIEEVLGAPPDSLFVGRVSRVSQDVA